MPRRATVVVGTDLVSSENAVLRAERVARTHGAALHVLHATRKLPPALRALVAADAADEQREHAELSEVGSRLRDSELPVETRVTYGGVASCLRRHARAMRASLIVLGSRGSATDSLVGSTAERVIEREGPPVLLARESGRRAYARVVIGVSSDSDLRRSLAAARFVAGSAPLSLVHACEGPFDRKLSLEGAGPASLRVYRRSVVQEAEEEMTARMETAGLTPSLLRVAYGVPWRVLRGEAKRGALLVIDRHDSKLSHALFGSVSRQVIAGTDTDVVLV